MRQCTACRQIAGPGGRFCQQCGERLPSPAAPAGSDVLLRLVDATDAPGRLKKRLPLRTNERALLFEGGQLLGTVRTGTVELGGIAARGARREAYVLRASPFRLTCEAADIRSAEGLQAELQFVARLQTDNDGAFIRNLPEGVRQLDVDDLADAISVELRQSAEAALQMHNLEDLYQSAESRERLEADLARELSERLAPLGLAVADVRLGRVVHEGLAALAAKDEQLWLEERHYALDVEQERQKSRRALARAGEVDAQIGALRAEMRLIETEAQRAAVSQRGRHQLALRQQQHELRVTLLALEAERQRVEAGLADARFCARCGEAREREDCFCVSCGTEFPGAPRFAGPAEC